MYTGISSFDSFSEDVKTCRIKSIIVLKLIVVRCTSHTRLYVHGIPTKTVPAAAATSDGVDDDDDEIPLVTASHFVGVVF
jgi:hypothetical protein